MPKKQPKAPTTQHLSDHEMLCAAVRFSLDEPERFSADEQAARDADVAKVQTLSRKSSIRATRAMLPRVHRLAEHAAEALMLEDVPEVYVAAASDLNAFACTDSRGRSICVLNHGLVPLLTDEELLAVIAHEIGHAGLRHAGRTPESFLAQVYGSQRSCAAEVSADRLAVLAVGSPATLAAALVKMQCGLPTSEFQVDVDAVMQQFAHPDNVDEDFDGLDSHPELPFRYWAMTRFEQSDLFARLHGRDGGEDFDGVEQEIEDRFHALDEGVAFVTTSEVVHHAVAWVGCLMVAHDERITARERAALSAVVGQIWAEDACHYAQRNGLRAVERRAQEALEPLRHAGLRTRRRVRDLIRQLGAKSKNSARSRRMIALVNAVIGKDGR